MAEPTPDNERGLGVPGPALARAEGPDAPCTDEPSSKVEQAAGLWSRIKEHKILQWGLAYLGAALALAHGQELLASTYEWPHSIGRIFMGVLILGLPVVLTFAWYHGHKGLKRFSAAEMTIVALLLVLVGGGFFLFVRAPESDSHGGTEGPAHVASAASESQGSAAGSAISVSPRENTTAQQTATPTETGVSLAVLPFVNMSDDKEQEYFSDGLSEELLNQLAQIKNLRVAGRTSSFAFKGKNEDLRIIGQALGVNHLLEGSVRKAGSELRITAQLINAADGSHLWSQTYDRELKDVFKVQEDIAKDVAQQLSVTLGVGATATPETGSTSLEAYDKYLRARALANTGTSPADFARAADMFKEVLKIDPGFAPARAALAQTYPLMLVFLPETSAQTLTEMTEMTKEALARAPDNWASHLADAVLLMNRHDWLKADAAFAQARALAPSSESTVGLLSALFFANMGRVAEAVRISESARSADPLSLNVTVGLQQFLDMAGRAGEAQAEYERTNDLPGNREILEHEALLRIWDSGDKARIDAQIRRFLDAEAVPMPVLSQVFKVFDSPPAALSLIRAAFKDKAYQDPTRTMLLGAYAAHFGDTDLALTALRRSFVDMNGITPESLWYPVFTEARKTAAFKQLVRDLGLVDYWRKSGHWADDCHPLGTDDFECK